MADPAKLRDLLRTEFEKRGLMRLDVPIQLRVDSIELLGEDVRIIARVALKDSNGFDEPDEGERPNFLGQEIRLNAGQFSVDDVDRVVGLVSSILADGAAHDVMDLALDKALGESASKS